MNPKTLALVLLSGGMDSTAALAMAVAHYDAVHALSINYGQRHKVELEAAKAVAAHFGVPHDIIDLSVLRPFLGGSSLTDDNIPVPEGHYAAPTMKATVVSNRNAIMLAIAFGVAGSRGADVVITAVHAGDHAIYPDCRPEFIAAFDAMQRLSMAGMFDRRTWLVAPFVNVSKTDIAKTGAKYGAPFHLTWSCYKGGDQHCGVCGTCVERMEAFRDAGLTDPTTYDA